jgi:DNA-directed RNA polymerase subunit H
MSKKDDKEEFSIMEHNLVPKHEILEPEETRKVLEQYHVKLHQLPYILSTDPVARGLDAKPGDVIRITRKSEVAGVSFYYRYVIEG